MAEQSERDILHDLIAEIDGLIADTRKQQHDLRHLEADIASHYQKGQITLLHYQIEAQTATRAHKNLRACLKSLEQQKKTALWKLRQLD